MASDEQAERSDGTIEVPAPTAWPFIAATGVTFLLAGLVTHVIVSAVGIVLLIAGGVGWFLEVFPHEQTERVPLEAPPLTVPVSREVARLGKGETVHRARLPLEFYPYSAGIKGGLAGGLAMAIPALLYGQLTHGSIWYAVNLLAATASATMTEASHAQLTAFSVQGLVLGAIIHIVMSILVGFVYAVMLPMLPSHPAFWSGLVAPLVWTGVIWAVLGVVNPALEGRIDWPWFVVSQVAFGLVAGFVVARSEPIATFQHAPFLARAGIEAPGLMDDRSGSEK